MLWRLRLREYRDAQGLQHGQPVVRVAMLDAAVFHGGQKLTSGCSKVVNNPRLAASNQDVLTELLYRGDDGPLGVQAQAEHWLRLNLELMASPLELPGMSLEVPIFRFPVEVFFSFDGATFQAVLGGQSAASKHPNAYNYVDSESIRDVESLQTMMFTPEVVDAILSLQKAGLTAAQQQEFARVTGTGLLFRTALQSNFLRVYLGPLHLMIRIAAALLAGEVRTVVALQLLPAFLKHLKECLGLEHTVIFDSRGSSVPRVALNGSNVKQLLLVKEKLLRCDRCSLAVDERIVAVFEDLWSQFHWIRDTLVTVDPQDFAVRAREFSHRCCIFARCGKIATGPAFVTPSVSRLINYVPLGLGQLVKAGVAYGALTEEGIEFLHWVKHLRAQFTAKGETLSCSP